jgi:hypothetical protein
MSNLSQPLEHPLLRAVAMASAALDDVAAAGTDPLFLPVQDKGALLRELTALAARVAALRAEVLAVADDLAAETADRSAGTWLAVETRSEPRDCLFDERLGKALRERWPQVREAVRAGRITWQQAGIVTHALDQLPKALDSELVGKAEGHLVTEAGQFGPRQLRRLGRKVLEVVGARRGRRSRA